jgi:hypothetical protein
MPQVILLTLILAAILFWQARRTQRKTGLPGGRVVYSDTRGWGKLDRPLYDARLGLITCLNRGRR